MVAEVLKEIMEMLGYTVVGIYSTVSSAVTAASTIEMDFAIVDVSLKEGMSYPVVKALQDRNIPFFFMSGMTHIPNPDFSHIQYVRKPASISAIEQAIKQLMA